MNQLSKTRRHGIKLSALCVLLAVSFLPDFSRPACATTIAELQQQIEEQQNKINSIQNKIGDLSDQKALLEEQIDDLNSEILNTMTSISLKEEAIEEKIEQIGVTETNIQKKSAEIDKTQGEYDQAVEDEEYQYQCMVTRTRLMYEKGSFGLIDSFMDQQGLGDFLNRMDYMESIYQYDYKKQQELKATREKIKALWDKLEQEKQDYEAEKEQLVQIKNDLEQDKLALQTQKTELDAALKELEKQSKSYSNQIAKWKQEASVATKLLKQEQRELKNLQDAENRRNQAANQTYSTTSYTDIINNASGSDLGKKVAQFACQYIGNPYVYGGTSLTNGTDCSGFTYRVYQNFGYTLPRTSAEQRSSGTGVEYSQAQPGDLICYSGHVGIYIGDGKIVHASSSTTGIIVSKATYRTILAVRRIL